MKNFRTSLVFAACAVAYPAFAQNAPPECVKTNYDQARNLFTIVNAAPDTVNQQCLLTIYPAGAPGARNPAPYMVEGNYDILLSGGGGGGSGGEYFNKGGGHGGAGAAPIQTAKYLSPGVYKLTIGTGGPGGKPGSSTYDGNVSSLTNFNSGELIAGESGADVAKQYVREPIPVGHGGKAKPGGSSGGDGGDAGPRNSESAAQAGGASQTPGFGGTGGRAGSESGRNAQANAGGGGGAGVGIGGDGQSVDRGAQAGRGQMGGGGAGGRGGYFSADAGGRGGHGFIKLTMAAPAPAAMAPAPEVVMIVAVAEVAVAPAMTEYVEPRAPTPGQPIRLSADALFDFDKSILTPTGKTLLDDLARELTGTQYDTILATGQTDRLGGMEYNQKLSERRAGAVKDYLVSKNIPADRITAKGMGETQPVTKTGDCPGAASAEVIACLQPDRRVDVEVTGNRDRAASRQ